MIGCVNVDGRSTSIYGHTCGNYRTRRAFLLLLFAFEYELTRQVDGLKLYSPTNTVETTGRRVGGLSSFFPFIFLVIYPFTYLRAFVDMEL